MYNGSKEQLKNFKNAGTIGNQVIQENKQNRITEYNKNPNTCKFCGNVFSYEKRGKLFCDNSCAAKFNNAKRKHSEETKNKISKTSKISRPQTIYIKKCIGCGIEYKTRKKNQKYHNANCARQYVTRLPENREKNRQAQLKLVKAGTHIGWKTRTVKPSYPEQYFIDLFEKENISGWIRDKKEGAYFIDFAFSEKMIALEIDGKQHWLDLDRIDSDIKKDKLLKERGWKVFRIKWFNPINDKNKKKLYPQIEEFKKQINK